MGTTARPAGVWGGVGTAARGGAHSARVPGLLHGISSSGLCGVEMRILKFKSSLFCIPTRDVQPLALPASLLRALVRLCWRSLGLVLGSRGNQVAPSNAEHDEDLVGPGP